MTLSPRGQRVLIVDDSPDRDWQHPWLRVERATQVVLADRLTYGASDPADAVLARIIQERLQIVQAGWLN